MFEMITNFTSLVRILKWRWIEIEFCRQVTRNHYVEAVWKNTWRKRATTHAKPGIPESPGMASSGRASSPLWPGIPSRPGKPSLPGIPASPSEP